MDYPIIQSNIIISSTACTAIDISTGRCYKIQGNDIKVLSLIDGVRSTYDIFEILSKENNVDYDNLVEYIKVWCERGFMKLSPIPTEIEYNDKEPIRIVNIELTDKCNLKCRYCYGGFHPGNKLSLTSGQIKALFSSLQKRGVRTVELSGGEPSLHQEFDEIVGIACRMFKNVTIMTNAVHFSDSTYKVFRQNRKNLGFSISIDGFSEKTNAFQRGTRNTFEKTLDNILKIKQEINPDYLRVVYMLTNENKHEIDAFFSQLLDYGIDNLLISIPEHIAKGRTYSLPDGCDMSNRNSASRKELSEVCEEMAAKYYDRVKTIKDSLGEQGYKLANALPSCGAGWTMLSIKSDGRVLPCNMMDERYVLGNCLTDPELNFLSRSNRLYDLLSKINLSSENDNRKVCLSCADVNKCNKCVNMILIANQIRVQNGDNLCPILLKNGFTVNDFASV